MTDLQKQVAEMRCPVCKGVKGQMQHGIYVNCIDCHGTGLRWPGL